MTRYVFNMYFIFRISIIIQETSGVLQNYERTGRNLLWYNVNDTFVPSCAKFMKMNGVNCTEGFGYVGENKIEELTFYDYAHLAEGMLKGYSIDMLILESGNITVDEYFLKGIKELKVFEARRSNIKTVPDFSFVGNSIMYLKIQSSDLTFLDGRNLQDLVSVDFLSFTNNYIRSIDPDVFRGTNNVLSLDLSHNLLTCIPLRLLDDMKRLGEFIATHNHLIHIDTLFSIVHPEGIYLDFNNITKLNSLLRVSVKDESKLSELKCNPHMRPLNGYRLDLSYNYIQEAPDSFFSCQMNASKDMPLIVLASFRLVGNLLQNLSASLRKSKILYLDVSKNKLQLLTDENFRFVYEIERLALQENQIRGIETNTFKSIRDYLSYLDLSSNEISSINGSIKYLGALKMLNLSYNSIQYFAEDEFTGLNNLSDLYLQSNRIKNIGQILQLPKIRYLNVTNNDIKLIEKGQISKSLTSVDLANNPFKCNCKLLPFILGKKRNTNLTTDINLCLRSDLENSMPQRNNCPDMCLCKCTMYRSVSFISADCSSKNLTVVPNFGVNNLPFMLNNGSFIIDEKRPLVLEQNLYPFVRITDRVLGINLENNSLESLEEAQIPPNLAQLLLFNNNLKRFPESVFRNQRNLTKVSLSSNPWNCDCSARNFKKWLISMHHIVTDFNDIRCGVNNKERPILHGKVIWNISDFDLCPTPDEFDNTSLFVSLSTFTILCLLSIILCKKYELNIKLFLYARGFTFVKEDGVDYHKEFDAFLSFSHDDDEFVIKEIVAEIEKKNPNICLCLHYRHFIPGEYICNNIIYAVQNSKRTVVILSKNFLQSEWCLYEFQTAHAQVLEDKLHRIIIIKVGDLPKEMDPMLKAYMKSTTYLTWGENKFWEKLLFILPSGFNIRNM